MANENAISDFAESIAAFSEGLAGSLTYIARRGEVGPYIIKARLMLHGEGMLPPSRLFVSDQIVAETIHLAELGLMPMEVVRQAMGGG